MAGWNGRFDGTWFVEVPECGHVLMPPLTNLNGKVIVILKEGCCRCTPQARPHGWGCQSCNSRKDT